MKRVVSPLLALIALLLVPGCSGDSGKQLQSGPSPEAEIKRIESDPSMPPQAKAAAIAQLRARQGGNGGGSAK